MMLYVGDPKMTKKDSFVVSINKQVDGSQLQKQVKNQE